MRKSHWISLGLAVALAGTLGFLEHRRQLLLREAAPTPAETFFSRLDRNLTSFMQRTEWATFDARFKFRGARKPHPAIAIIGIDKYSLDAVGQWPWSRRIHADLINKLQEGKPRALLFDVFFENAFTADLAGDQLLAKATQKAPWVIHAVYFEPTPDGKLALSMPIQPLLKVEPFVGFVNSQIEEDGILRRALMRERVGDDDLDLLSLAGTALYMNRPPEDLLDQAYLDPAGRMLLNFAGPEFSFHDARQEAPSYIPYVDVLKGTIPPSFFKDKIVLIGASATGTYDHYPTPFSKAMPGVEVHATVIDNLLRGNSLRYVGPHATWVIILVMGLLCGWAFGRMSPLGGAGILVLLGLTYLGVCQWLFTNKYLVVAMAAPLLTLILSYTGIILYRFFTEEKEKRWVKGAFGQYVSPKVLDVLLDNPSKLGLGGERREMTAFFSDVAGFTSISERLNPDELVVLLNRYLTAMTEVVFEYDGYLNKYMGDGIMAFWNAPVRQGDHAARACRAALKSVQKLAELNAELHKEGMIPLKARIGINSGQMAVGNMGSNQKFDYTIMGDHVNLASRLEGANKPYGTAIMISEFTYELVQNEFEVRYIDIMRVPGKAKPVKTYELLGEKGSLPASLTEALPFYHDAVLLMGERKFSEAREKFAKLHEMFPEDRLYEVHYKRMVDLIASPPAKEWDGVYDVKVK